MSDEELSKMSQEELVDELRLGSSLLTRRMSEAGAVKDVADGWFSKEQLKILVAVVKASRPGHPGVGDAVDYVRSAGSRGGLSRALFSDIGPCHHHHNREENVGDPDHDNLAWACEEYGEDYEIGYVQGLLQAAELFGLMK